MASPQGGAGGYQRSNKAVIVSENSNDRGARLFRALKRMTHERQTDGRFL